MEDGSGEETRAKKVITLQKAMTKKVVSFFSRKNRVTPSVAAPGDTNPSDATGCWKHQLPAQWRLLIYHQSCHQLGLLGLGLHHVLCPNNVAYDDQTVCAVWFKLAFSTIACSDLVIGRRL